MIAFGGTVFVSPDGTFPPPEQLGAAVSKAVTDALTAASGGGWSVTWAPELKPKEWYTDPVNVMLGQKLANAVPGAKVIPLTPWKCQRGPKMKWYRTTGGPSFYESSDAGGMDVIDAAVVEGVTWLCVYKSDKQQVWVKAQEARA